MKEFEFKTEEFSFPGVEEKKEEPEILSEEPKKTERRRTVALVQREKKTLYRRAFSETQLMDAVGLNFQEGEIYNCITAGDVDGLSYLKVGLRQQPLDYVLISTWVMANDDILQIEEWLKSGQIKKCDVFVGEIFPNSYRVEYQELLRVITEDVGRVAVFRNHSKIFAGYGPKFYFGIQTSANINTNPRTENGSITINREIFEFYKEYFDGIVSFDKQNRKK
jgi:hypothetical protein